MFNSDTGNPETSLEPPLTSGSSQLVMKLEDVQ